MMRALLVASCCALALGCESAEHKCEAARGAALAEWDAYIDALEQARERAVTDQRESTIQLNGKIERRLMPLAQQRADKRYPRSSEAWLRASQSAYHELCDQDPTCHAQRERKLQAQSELDDIDERLPLARAARDAARGDVASAQQAAAAAIIHPEFPQLKEAKARVSELVQRCRDLPAPQSTRAANP